MARRPGTGVEPVRGQIVISPEQRFRLNRPCPVCGGHADLPHGEGRRCYGYLSEDGCYAHCTREEHAGPLDRNLGSDTFAHILRGVCRCGKEHGATTAPAQLQSEGGQDAPSVYTYRDLKLGKPAQAMEIPVRQWRICLLHSEVEPAGERGGREGVPPPGPSEPAVEAEGPSRTSTALQPAYAVRTPQCPRPSGGG